MEEAGNGTVTTTVQTGLDRCTPVDVCLMRCSSKVVESLEVEPRREPNDKLSQGPLTSGHEISAAVESIDEHGNSLGTVNVEDDASPLVEVGTTAEEVGKVTVVATKVVGSNADSGDCGRALRKRVSDLEERMD